MKLKSLVASVAAACAAASLGGCYVVPVDHRPVYVPVAHASAAPAPVPAPIQVRLYPVNEMASKTGPLTAVVIDNANGHGTFQLHYAGEYLTGEATRLRVGQGQGVANAAGSGGTFVKCNYTVTANSRGIGNCNFSNGAHYQLHFGS